MLAVVLDRGFGVGQLTLQERPLPEVPRGSVLLEMRAASLNYRDLLMVRGEYDPKQPLPLVPVSDGVGRVVAVGPGTQGVRVGDRACPVFASGWLEGRPSRATLRATRGGPLEGVLQEYLCVPAEDLVKVPDFLTDTEAATLPCAAVTAYSALFRHGSLGPNDTLLTQGTGGVSLFALTLARAVGARVIATSRSHAKLELLHRLGADTVLDTTKEPEFGRTVRKLSGNEGVDHALEVAGGAALAESLEAVRPGGQLSLVGMLAGTRAPNFNLLPILMRDVRVQGVFVGPRSSFIGLNCFLEEHQLRPIIDRVFELREVQAAFAHLEGAQHVGKICVRISPDAT